MFDIKTKFGLVFRYLAKLMVENKELAPVSGVLSACFTFGITGFLYQVNNWGLTGLKFLGIAILCAIASILLWPIAHLVLVIIGEFGVTFPDKFFAWLDRVAQKP